MRSKSRLFQPGATSLEPRLLLTAAEVSTLRAATIKPLLSETVEGRYQFGQDNRAADAPLRIKLTGTGQTDRTTKMTANLNFGGLRMENAPDISGVITLSNKQGSIKLKVLGTGGNTAVAGQQFVLNAGVVKGTGAYAGVQSVGTLTVSFATDGVRSGRVTTGHTMVSLDLVSPVR